MFKIIYNGLTDLMLYWKKKLETYEISNPKFYKASFVVFLNESKEPDLFLMNFIYENLNYFYKFSMPVNLEFNSANREQNKQKFKVPQEVSEENNRNNYLQRYKLFKYKPAFMVSAIFLCIASIIGINIAFAVGGASLPIIFGAPIVLPLILSIAAVLLTTAYIIPAVTFHYREKVSKPRLLKALKEIYLLIKQRRFQEACLKMLITREKYMHMLYPHFNFPNNHELQWLWNLVNIMYADADAGRAIDPVFMCIKRGLKLCKSDEERFVFIKAIINIKDLERLAYRQSLDKAKNLEKKEKKAQIENDLLSCQKYLLPFLVQVPFESIAHKDYCLAIHYKLKKINDLLLKGYAAKAGNEFMKIKWEGYHKHALPKASIIYYQLRAIFTALHPKYLNLHRTSHYHRLFLAREVLHKIERYLAFSRPYDLIIQPKNKNQGISVAFLPLQSNTRERTTSLEIQRNVDRPRIGKKNSARF